MRYLGLLGFSLLCLNLDGSAAYICFEGAEDHYSCSAPEPGGRADFTQKALHYANEVELRKLESNTKGKKIQDVSGVAKVGFKVHYDFTDIIINSFTIQSAEVFLQPPSTFKWTASGASASLSANWKLSTKLLKTHGSAKMSVEGVSFTASVLLGSNSKELPTLQMSNCMASVASCRIDISGKAPKFIYSLFTKVIEKYMKKQTSILLCNSVSASIVKLQERINKLDFKQKFWKDQFFIDYGLASGPRVATDLLSVDVKGESFWTGAPQRHCPLTPQPLPAPSGNRMVYVTLSQYVFNCLSYQAHSSQLLARNFSKTDLPDKEKHLFNTTCDEFSVCMGSYVPAIAKLFPNSSVELTAATLRPPMFNISSVNVSSEISFSLHFFVRKSRIFDLFTLNVIRIAGLKGSIVNNTLVGMQLPNPKISVTVAASAVGPILAQQFKALLQTVDNFMVTPAIDKLLGIGLKLPDSGDLSFVDAKLELHEGSLQVASDLKL